MIRLNLLPPQIKEEILLSKKNMHLRQLMFKLAVLSISFAALFSVVIFYLYTQKAGAEEQKALANKQIEATTANYNNALSLYSRVTGIKNIKKNAINWTKVLNEIGSQTPMNVEIGTISFSTTATGRTRISGFGASDKDIVLFKENLAKSDFFQFVDLDSIGEGSDSKSRSVKSFTISLTLNLGKAK